MADEDVTIKECFFYCPLCELRKKETYHFKPDVDIDDVPNYMFPGKEHEGQLDEMLCEDCAKLLSKSIVKWDLEIEL